MTTDFVQRSFAAPELETGDGRTIVGLVVPFDIESEVSDPPELGGTGIPYREVWRAGAFRNVVKAPHLVRLNYEHGRELGAQIATGTELVERDDGLHATFRALESPFGDQGLALVRSGSAVGLSIGARMHERGSRGDPRHGLVEPIRVARIEHVALTDHPAYVGAGVTAVRSALVGDKGPEFVAPVPAADELGQWLDWLAETRAHSRRS